MANIKSQKKRVITNAKAQERNKAVRSSLKTAVKHVQEAIDAGDKALATERLAAASREFDKAVSKGVLHANQAANRKSGMAKAVAKTDETKKAAPAKAKKAVEKPAAEEEAKPAKKSLLKRATTKKAPAKEKASEDKAEKKPAAKKTAKKDEEAAE